jgi:DNA topoisomerase-1
MTDIFKYWLFRQFQESEQNQNQNKNSHFQNRSANKWKWSTLEHNGVLFPPEWEQHNIPILYNGNKIQLNKEAEEFATAYAKYWESPYKEDKVFNKNFWKGWKKMLDDSTIENLESCDFSPIYNYLLGLKEIKLNLSKEEKLKIKEQKDNLIKHYKIAIVNDKEQSVGNFMIEPPGIFIGRGCHPKLGTIKKRILPKDIIINISKETKELIPYYLDDKNFILKKYENSKYKKIIHDRSVEWLASWPDPITGKTKYVMLGASSDFKSQSDIKKFDLARKLKKNIKRIRKTNEDNLKSNDIKLRQIGTALFFIDRLALRVGNEKGDDAADTVGVVSLRLEHVKLEDDNVVKLDFLGKDSIRYVNKIKVENIIYNNLKEFIRDKDKYDQIFDKIQPNDINKYLQSLMKDLTAKVFRTYNASNAFQKELTIVSNKILLLTFKDEKDKIKYLMDEFNKANAKVAKICNHQKNITKSFGLQMEKLENMIKEVTNKIKKSPDKDNKTLKVKLKKLKMKKLLKKELKNVSLGTSKVNYIDPRITVAFMKKHSIDFDKIFTKVLQEKFKWAFDIDENFRF